MATVHEPQPVLLFLGIMFSDTERKDLALLKFQERYGSIIQRVGPFSFSEFSNYYDSEIGDKVLKEYYQKSYIHI